VARKSGLKHNAHHSETARACLARLRSVAPALHPAEKRVADYLLQNASAIVGLSITELADQCAVSEATIVRLCQGLGYRGYQELRLILSNDSGVAASDIHEEVVPEDTTTELVRKVFNSSGQALQDTLAVLDYDEFDRAVEAVARASSVYFYGVGGSGAIAFDAAHKFLKIGMLAVAHNDPHLQAMSASVMKRGCVAVGISHTGTTVDTIHALTQARESGATTICITSYSRSPITQVADIKLVTASRASSLRGEAILARLVELALLDALYVAVSLRRYDKTLESIRRTSQAVAGKRL